MKVTPASVRTEEFSTAVGWLILKMFIFLVTLSPKWERLKGISPSFAIIIKEN